VAKKCFSFLAGMSFVFALLNPVLLHGQASDVCIMCHGNASLSMTKQGQKVSLFVDAARFKASVHASIPCLSCHKGLNPGAMPHAKVIEPVRCQTCHKATGFETSVHGKLQAIKGKKESITVSCQSCHGTHNILKVKDPASSANPKRVSETCGKCHEDAARKYAVSAHGIASSKGTANSPSCTDCHGAHKIVAPRSEASLLYKPKEPQFCLKCHLNNSDIRRQVGFSALFMEGYESSIHGKALASGNLKAASCSDCHGAHDAKNVMDSTSRISRWNIAETCGKCHADVAKTYGESIHGKAVKRGSAESPTCTNCHGDHHIYATQDPRSAVSRPNVAEKVCASCHNSVRLNQKYGIASDRFASFADSFHGLASKGGSLAVANCASCHGVHNIKPSSDPQSTIHPSNLMRTCGQCHPGANQNFAKGAVHVIEADAAHSQIIYWIRAIYIAIILLTIGAMLLHNLLDFIRKARKIMAIRWGRMMPEHRGSNQYVRMTRLDRIQHAGLFTSFILLAITGFMLRFPEAWWVAAIRRHFAGFFDLRGILHRVAAGAMLAVSLWHLFTLIFTRHGRKFFIDILPRWKDARDMWTNALYLLGVSKNRPRFDRFGYIEKAEYWALVWGLGVMVVTGIFLGFNNFFIGQFTKLGWDISRTIHYYEALLATLAIVVWHFYYVIFNPSIYPMNTAWITGKISEEEMAEDHPLELEKMRNSESASTEKQQ
jgi:predicted CXXCH cytochrome family protein